MKKTIIILMITILVLSVAASGSILIPANDRAKEQAKAPEHSPVIGENWDLERVDFIHYARPEGKGKPKSKDTCYKLMGVKWKSLPVDYVVNPLNSGLSEDFVMNTFATSSEIWDTATSSELFNLPTLDYTAQYGIQNFVNAVEFDNYGDPNVIGVTSVWYMRKGKQIVEFDMMFNTGFTWGDASLDPSVMDLENIATHELGHAVGMGDIYTTTCSVVTMYGYSNYGEISKRSLEQPDIAGLVSMYG